MTTENIQAQQDVLETLRQRNQELAALNAIANILRSPFEIAQSMDQVCEQIATITGMETVTVHLRDEARPYLNLAACRGLTDALCRQVSQLGLDDPVTHNVAVEGQTIALNDLINYTGVGFAGPRVEGYHAGIGVPILQRGNPIGMIFVGSKTRTSYEPSDVALLRNIGNQIGNALENARLYAQMERRVQELDGLAQLSAACVASLDLEVLARVIVTWTKRLMQVHTCTVRMVEEESVRLYAAAHHSPKENPVPRMPLDAWVRSILEERKSYIVMDLQADPTVAPSYRAYLTQLGLRSLLVVPMLARDRVVGILSVGRIEPHQWEPREVNLLRTIANQVGVALDNARLYAQTQQRVQELDGLAQISAAVVANFDPQAIAEIVVEWTQKLYGVDVVDLSLFRDGMLYRMAARVNHGGAPITEPITLGELTTHILERRAPLIIRNLQEEPNAPELARQLMEPRGLQALLVVPLVTHERAIGTLAVVHTRPRQWSTQERDLLQTIANQVGNAIENAQLFQTVLNEQRKVQAIFDSGLSGLFATDAAGNIVMFNRAAERITGWTLAEVRGRNWADLLSDRAAGNQVEALLEQALLHKQAMYVPEGRKMRTRDGRIIPVAKAAAPLLDEKENVIGAVGAFWDLTKEQRTEIEYENFLAMITHQLRSPLSSVLSALDLFERRNLPDKQRAELWAIIKTEGNQLKKLADQFLERQAVAKSPRPVQLEPLSVAVLARRLVRQFQTAPSKHHFRIQTSRAEPLAFADTHRVEQVLRNLLDNAISYSPAGSRITIRIKSRDADWVDVSVQDCGAGIPPAEQDHIFQPFYRVPQTSARRVYGHGLGLSLAKDMVTAMGGKIWVESEPQHGATFHFTLRRAR
ncbi:MAG: GAF domain-containing protein [Chloroflexota bacterium]